MRLVVFTAVFLSLDLSAAEPNPIGFPKVEDPKGGIGAFRIWHEDGKWHLRTSTENSEGKKEKLLIFTGSVRCDGKLTVDAKSLEKAGKVKDTIQPTADGRGFDFDFRTYGATDEAIFKVPDSAKTLTFKLKVDGENVPPIRILIGAKGERPEKSEFKLPANPKTKK